MKIAISLGEMQLQASLSDSETARAVYEALPIESPYQVWGNEIYFTVPVESAEEPVRDLLEVGELAFWPPGKAFCIFYGPTPASVDDEPRAASKVVPFGKIEGEASVLRGAKAPTIRIEKWEE